MARSHFFYYYCKYRIDSFLRSWDPFFISFVILNIMLFGGIIMDHHHQVKRISLSLPSLFPSPPFPFPFLPLSLPFVPLLSLSFFPFSFP
ncbi:hypothetical protein GLOIN_2v1629951, partial [Rhizophagus irregularis DAOM 181602=DAOM 197198]